MGPAKFAVPALALLAGFAGCSDIGPSTAFNSAQFNSAQWREQRHKRHEMIHDLQTNHLSKEMHQSEIVELLGQPERILSSAKL